LYRNLDVVLFDTTDIQGLRAVFPAGRLREPLEATKGAGAFVFTRAVSLSSVQPIQQRLEESLGESLRPIILKSVPKRVQHLVTGQVRGVEFLLEFSIVVVSGIGNPQAFREMLLGCGSEIVEEISFPDHCAYGQDEIHLIRQKISQKDKQMVMTTEKDAVKLREWFTKEDPIWFISTDLEFMAGEHHLFELMGQAGLV
jgi:tetraacyldisaccharide 4'-kinase